MLRHLWPISVTGILAGIATRFVMINLNPGQIQAQIIFSLTTLICIASIGASILFSIRWKLDKLSKTKYEKRISDIRRECLKHSGFFALGSVGIMLLRINNVLTPITVALLFLNLGALILTTK